MATYVYGLFGGFLFDDYENIVNNRAVSLVDGSMQRWIQAAMSSNSGLLNRPISMLTFAVNHYFFGMNPVAFKVVNLLLHLMSGFLIYALGKTIIPYLSTRTGFSGKQNNAQWIALFVATCWLLHPLHVSDVMYIVQRMNQLSTLFTLIGLLCYVKGRVLMLCGKPGFMIASAGLLAFGVCAIFSKENGALIFLYALVVEMICFRFRDSGGQISTKINTLFIVIVGLPGLIALVFILTNPEWLLLRYEVRDFTLTERAITQPRILLHYLLWIFVPLPSFMGLYHDDIQTSKSLLDPATSLGAILLLASLIFAAWRMREIFPGLLFAALWFAVGHSMESTIIPLEMAFEHRNYLPMAGLFLGIGASLGHLKALQIHPRTTGLICILTISALASTTAQRNYVWRSPITLAIDGAENHPKSARSLYEAGRAAMFDASQGTDAEKIQGRIAARDYFHRAMSIDTSTPYAAIAYILTYVDTQSTVDSDLIADLADRLERMPMFKAQPVLRLIDTVSEGRLKIAPNDIRRIFSSSMENRTARSSQKAMLLNSYGRYHFQVLGDTQGAISLTLAAAEQEPQSPLFQISLARLAVAIGQPNLATQHANNAETLDRGNIFTLELSDVRKKIRDIEHIEKSQTSPPGATNMRM